MSQQETSTIKRDLALCAGGALAILLFIMTTDPASLSVVLLLLLPVLVGAVSYLATRLSLKIFTDFSEDLSRALCIAVAVGATLVVALGSLGQLGIQDIVLTAILTFAAGFYLKRLRATRG